VAPVRPLPLTVLAALLTVTACGSSHPRTLVLPQPTGPATTAGPAGDVGEAALSALLLQASDVPDLPQRRAFADPALTTQLTPQLGLCDPSPSDSPHEVANVLADPATPTAARVFEVVAVYPTAALAQQTWDKALATARSCTSYAMAGTPYTVQDLAEVPGLGAGVRGLHYRLLTPEVVSGDVRTFAQQGRYTVLVTGYGRPPAGQTLLAYQRDVLVKALRRLPAR
jgi:hypothetical protein